MKMRLFLNDENKALWDTLQYRYRNYIESEMIRRGDMSNDELNEQIKPLILYYKNNYEPLKVKVRTKKSSAASKIARIRSYITELESSLNEHSRLEGKYAIYEQATKDATKRTIERLKNIIED